MPFPEVLIISNLAPLLHPSSCAITMIYFTTFILTLLFAHIARAAPGCGNDAYPQEVYDPIYDDGQLEDAFPGVDATFKVTWDATYDNPNGNTNGTAGTNHQRTQKNPTKLESGRATSRKSTKNIKK